MSSKFRCFKVIDKVKESSVITSFYFKPDDQDPLWLAAAGQYLTLRLPIKSGSILKTYSLSHDVRRTDCYRITVKRESAPLNQVDIPEGVGSCWLHDQVEIGDLLEIAAPRGSFVLNETHKRPVVLLSGGVGQTPLLAMLHNLVNTQREVLYLHACEDGDVHAMKSEVSSLAEKGQGRIRSHVVYRQPTEKDKQSNTFDDEGFIDKSLLKSLMPIDDFEVYLCGPTSFMEAMYLLLVDLGVSKNSIAYEFFGTGSSLESLVADSEKSITSSITGSKAPKSIANLKFITNPDAWAILEQDNQKTAHANSHSNSTDVTDNTDARSVVHFSRSGLTVDWSSNNKSLLELAEINGLMPKFSCRSGICNSCKYSLLKGGVEYFEEPLDPPAKKEVLLCCSRPLGDIEIDL